MTWLRCKVGPSAFSDESVVEVTTADGKELSFFVPKDRVQSDRVRVRVSRRGGKTWVLLPTADPVHAITVPPANVVEEATA